MDAAWANSNTVFHATIIDISGDNSEDELVEVL